MEEWWEREYNIISKANINHSDLLGIIESTSIALRAGVKETFEICKSKNIPISVLSAGIGNLVEIMLAPILHENVKIKSNFLIMEDTGKFAGFKKPLIHSGNKADAVNDLDFEAALVIGDMPSVIVI